jgi:RimJ/RimL family protein N-acetyltransferase
MYTISPLSEENARKITTWCYDPPYDLYDLAPEHLQELLDPDLRYHQVLDQSGVLVGFCCFGWDAQVPGGEYQRGEPEVLDIGVGLCPPLTGQGQGAGFVGEILEYGRKVYRPEIFRVTIAGFNQRSLKTFQKLGFVIKSSFKRELVDVFFFQLERPI